MSFWKKEEKQDNASTLPELPELPELPPLPQFPEQADSGLEAGFIKSSIDEKPKNLRVSDKATIELSDLGSNANFMNLGSAVLKPNKEQVFVKLDKFQDAILKFDEVKKRVAGIENALEKLKAVRMKENMEIMAWEEEMKVIKEKVSAIDMSLFSKI